MSSPDGKPVTPSYAHENQSMRSQKSRSSSKKRVTNSAQKSAKSSSRGPLIGAKRTHKKTELVPKKSNEMIKNSMQVSEPNEQHEVTAGEAIPMKAVADQIPQGLQTIASTNENLVNSTKVF